MTLEELLAGREQVKQDVRVLADQISERIAQGKLDGFYPDGYPVELTNINNMTEWYTSVVKLPEPPAEDPSGNAEYEA